MNSVVYKQIPLPDPALVAEAAKYGVADLHEALGTVQGRMSLMSPRMRPILDGRRICGPAVTSYNYPGDNLMIHVALQLTQAGQILVVSNGGGAQGALWGDIVCAFAKQKGISGVIADGPIRDVDAVRAMEFPVWATIISPAHAEKRGPGAVNIPIVADGVLVEPGDVVVADSDGVLVIPRLLLQKAVDGARARATKEAALRVKINAGGTYFEALGLDVMVKAAGIEEHDATWEDHLAK